MGDRITITIQSDGSLKFEVAGSVSGPNHASAESFLRLAAELAAGDTVREKLPHAHEHAHEHDHAHVHQK